MARRFAKVVETVEDGLWMGALTFSKKAGFEWTIVDPDGVERVVDALEGEEVMSYGLSRAAMLEDLRVARGKVAAAFRLDGTGYEWQITGPDGCEHVFKLQDGEEAMHFDLSLAAVLEDLEACYPTAKYSRSYAVPATPVQ